MTDIILHHYDLSPFSEKIRLALGFKELSWSSVKVDAVPPRPYLETLTGGYRRLPVLQMGADIYCDSEVIFRALERMKPSPTLYPTGEGIAKALSHWWDRATWKPAIGVLVAHIGQHLPDAFLKDRREQYLGYDISKEGMAPLLPAYVQQLVAAKEWLSSMLSQHGAFLTGGRLSAADITCYHSLWLLRANAGEDVIDAQLHLGRDITDWMARVAEVGHGTHTDLTPEDALAVAKNATPVTTALGHNDPSGISVGTSVTVTPNDNARVPVAGRLVAADGQEVVIAYDADEAGSLHIHFPRAGFEVIPAAA